jgi:hypothetical protein
VALLDAGDHLRDVAGIVLQVAIREHHQPAARIGDAGRKRGGLSEVATKADDAQPWIAGLEGRELRERVVLAPVVYDEEFVAAPVFSKHGCEFFIQTRDIGRLVVDRDDDRKLGSHRARQSGHYISSPCPDSMSFRVGQAASPACWV